MPEVRGHWIRKPAMSTPSASYYMVRSTQELFEREWAKLWKKEEELQRRELRCNDEYVADLERRERRLEEWYSKLDCDKKHGDDLERREQRLEAWDLKLREREDACSRKEHDLDVREAGGLDRWRDQHREERKAGQSTCPAKIDDHSNCQFCHGDGNWKPVDAS
ncbi:hypothetical protein AGMMS50225_20920 [Betaproteobacteria bacterium]|nr:hypothetical protein AGMMS50225_20920 [Betaproteobacteria bacterium]